MHDGTNIQAFSTVSKNTINGRVRTDIPMIFFKDESEHYENAFVKINQADIRRQERGDLLRAVAWMFLIGCAIGLVIFTMLHASVYFMGAGI